MSRLNCMAALLAALAGPAVAADSPSRLYGYAYDLKTKAHLYTEVHEQKTENDRWLSGTITYLAPDGGLIGTKTLDFSQDPFIPVYRMDLKPGGGYVEGISALTQDSIAMFKQGYGEKALTEKKVARPDATTADSGFHSFIRSRFTELMDRKTVKFNFAVAGELDVFKFRGRRIADGTFEDRPAVRFLIEPSTLLSLLVDPLELTYEPASRKLLEYRGVSNLHHPATGDAYEVRIVYPSKPPAEAATLPAEYQ